MPFFLTFLVLAFGTTVNVHNSGDAVDTVDEAKIRVVAAVVDGYGRDSFVTHKLND